jgi:hypothetical protein
VIIREDQFDELQTTYRKDFLLQTISDWYVLYERVYGIPAKMPFENAWDISDDIVTRLEEETVPATEDPAYELIHETLLATERSVPQDRIESAFDSFYSALPAVAAAGRAE